MWWLIGIAAWALAALVLVSLLRMAAIADRRMPTPPDRPAEKVTIFQIAKRIRLRPMRYRKVRRRDASVK